MISHYLPRFIDGASLRHDPMDTAGLSAPCEIRARLKACEQWRLAQLDETQPADSPAAALTRRLRLAAAAAALLLALASLIIVFGA